MGLIGLMSQATKIMRLSCYIWILILPLILCSCQKRNAGLVVVCGWDEVFISDISIDVPEKIWSWTAEDSDGLPASMRNKFLTTDECKPVSKGREILITSSGGGIALINRKDKKVSFYASLPNAHSAEILPGNRVAVAGSYSQEGNCINLYDAGKPNIVLFSDSLYGAHGLLWDRNERSLWALGDYELRKYRLGHRKNNGTSLKLDRSYDLPGDGGHDLAFHEESKDIALSTQNNVWIFDTKSELFTKHPLLGEEINVKSISFNKATGETAYVKSTDDNWWAYYIRFAGSERVVYLPYEKIYKVRWLY